MFEAEIDGLREGDTGLVGSTNEAQMMTIYSKSLYLDHSYGNKNRIIDLSASSISVLNT